MPVHVFDASIWIHVGRYHPADIFGNLWSHLDGAIAAEDLRSPDEVLHELERGDDGLADQLRSKNGLFVPLTPALQTAVTQVMRECRGLSDPEAERNRGDPFVVALARQAGGIVVTGERPRRAPDAPMKIPDACNHFGLPYIDWFGYLRSQGWRL